MDVNNIFIVESHFQEGFGESMQFGIPSVHRTLKGAKKALKDEVNRLLKEKEVTKRNLHKKGYYVGCDVDLRYSMYHEQDNDDYFTVSIIERGIED